MMILDESERRENVKYFRVLIVKEFRMVSRVRSKIKRTNEFTVDRKS